MRYQWAKLQGVWGVVLVKENGFHCFDGKQYLHEMMDVQEWGPICWPPREQMPLPPLVVDSSDLGVVNAADYGDKKLEGEVYVAPDFEIFPKRNGDCAVVALANVLHLNYNDAKLTAFQHGWSSIGGMSEGLIELIVEKKGFKTFFRKDLTNKFVYNWGERGYSVEGTFLVYCKDHVMPACGDGKFLCLANQQGCQSREVLSVIEIRKNIKNSPCN